LLNIVKKSGVSKSKWIADLIKDKEFERVGGLKIEDWY
jgi:hypothetical protein